MEMFQDYLTKKNLSDLENNQAFELWAKQLAEQQRIKDEDRKRESQGEVTKGIANLAGRAVDAYMASQNPLTLLAKKGTETATASTPEVTTAVSETPPAEVNPSDYANALQRRRGNLFSKQATRQISGTSQFPEYGIDQPFQQYSNSLFRG